MARARHGAAHRVVAVLVAALGAGPCAAGTPGGERAAPSAPLVERLVPSPPPAESRAAALLPEPLPVDLRLPPARDAAPGALAELEAWNAEGRLPLREGFTRPLSPPVELLGTASPARNRPAGRLLAAPDGAVLWLWGVEVPGAFALRLRLTGLALPPGARVRVAGERPGSAAEVDVSAAAPGGELFTPSVEGARAWLEVELPGGVQARGRLLAVTGVVELVRFDAALPAGTECFVNGECAGAGSFPGLEAVRKAVARLRFVVGGSAYLCSGSLIADVPLSGAPYLLTANHCLSTQSAASSLEATFDYRYTACGTTAAPSLGSLPRTVGATLLTTSAASDFTLLRLSQAPSGQRAFLGWDSSSSAVASGTNLFRLAHPSGGPQTFSRSRVDVPAGTCYGMPTSHFVYQARLEGSTTGGSSGSPVVTASGTVVGQLTGPCGVNTSDPCDFVNSTVDGAFWRTYPLIQPWLAPAGGCVVPSTPSLAADRTTVAAGQRYLLSWPPDAAGGTESWRLGVSYAATGPFETAATYAATTTSVSLTAAFVDVGRTLHYRIQAVPFGGSACEPYAATSNVVSVAVTSSGTTTCSPDVTTLCLHSRRFKVQASYVDYAGVPGSARAVALTDDSGYFWFFTSTNVEMVAKVVPFCDGASGNYGFYASGLTDVDVTFTVADTRDGITRQYRNPLGTRFCTIADGPFACP